MDNKCTNCDNMGGIRFIHGNLNVVICSKCTKKNRGNYELGQLKKKCFFKKYGIVLK